MKLIKIVYLLSEQNIIMLRCPECKGMLVCNKFEMRCKNCGLVAKEPLCIGGVIVFE